MKNRRKILVKVLALLLISTSLLVGCESASSEDTITFGAALPLTGDLSTEGKKHQDGYELWKDKVNANGGIDINGEKFKVEIKYYDYESDIATAVKLVEKLITEDGVKAIFGPMGSASAKAVSAVTEKYQVPMIAPSASSEEVFTDGYKYIFGTFTPNETLTDPLADIALNVEDGPKTAAIIARNDLFPLAIGEAAKKSVEDRGIEVVAFEQYPVGATDLSPLLIQINRHNPDWIFATGYANDVILINKQMKELNINPKMLTMVAGASYKEFVEGLQSDANYVTTAAWWHNSVQYEGDDVFSSAQNYTKLFEEKYDYTPDYVSASASVVGVLFQEAIENAGTTDPVKVRDALANLDIMTFYGPIKFDQKGMVSSLEPPVLQILDKKHITLYPEIIKNGEFNYPVPNWNER